MNKKALSLSLILSLVLSLLPMTTGFAAEAHVWPLIGNFTITSYFGNRTDPFTGEIEGHGAIDIGAPYGTPVYASSSGTLRIGFTGCEHNYAGSCSCGGGYGNYVYIDDVNGMRVFYAHLTSVTASAGYIEKGTQIGTVGSTGSSTGAHLHFEMRTGTSKSTRVDPLNYVSSSDQITITNATVPTNVQVSTYGTDVTVTWNASSNATHYDVYLLQEPWGWDDIKYSATVYGTTCYFTGITPGYYSVFVIARPNSDTAQSEWKGVTVMPLPSAPTNVTTSVSGKNVTVSWNASTYATSYDVYLIQSPNRWEDVKYSQSTTGTSCTFTGVSAGTYSAFVIARPNDNSVQSNWSGFSVYDSPPIAPTVIGSYPAYHFKGDQITVSWNSVANAERYSYYLAQHPTGYAYDTPTRSGVTTGTSVTFSDLAVGEYIFFVHADNGAGSSPQSNWVSIIVNDNDYVPATTVIYNNHFYALYDNWTSWSYAKNICERMGGHLVTITSKEENEFIQSLIDAGQSSGYWMGLTDENRTAYDFAWITGETVTFTDWASGDPNNWGEYGNREDYAQIHKNYNYNWIDTSNCSPTSVGFILEIELENISSTAEQAYNGSKYLLFDQNMTWTEARKYCESLGGHLATINSEEEYEFMSDFLELGNRSWYFLGGIKNNGVFQWVDNSESVPASGDNSHWLDGCPTSDANRNYMMMYKDSKKWNELKNFYDYSDHMKYLGFVCEIEFPCTQTTVRKNDNTYTIETRLYNITDSCDILVAGYKTGQFATLKSVPYSQDNMTFTLAGDIDEIKVMVWDKESTMQPLCDTEVIPGSAFITK